MDYEGESSIERVPLLTLLLNKEMGRSEWEEGRREGADVKEMMRSARQSATSYHRHKPASDQYR